MFQYNEKYVEALFKDIYAGRVTPRVLPRDLYFAIADYLKGAIYQGYGTDLFELKKNLNEKINSGFTEQDLELLQEMRTNIYLFSAAKTYQQVREMSSSLISDDGVIVSFKEFREKAEKTYELFNKTWLQTEYDTAIGQAQSARKWQIIEQQADVLPLLEYHAVLDSRTSEICRPLDGIIAPVNDPIWKRVAPLNHFNCRCMLKQLDEGKVTGQKAKEERVNETLDKMQDLFKINTGIDGYIFSKEHPYFDVAPKDKSFARRNFDLPIPVVDKPIPKLEPKPEPKFKPAKTIKEAEKWAVENGLTKQAIYSGISLDNVNAINKTLKQVFDDFALEPLDFMKGGARSLGLGNGRQITFNKSKMKPDEVKRIFESGVTNYQSKNEARLKQFEAMAENSPTAAKAVKELKQTLNFKRWTVHLKEEHVIEDLFIHEAGHVVEDQLLGLINRRLVQKRFGQKNPATGLIEFTKETADMRTEWMKVHAALSKEDLYKISRYGASDHHETFAESLVMYYREPENMPASIKGYFDKLKDYAKRQGDN